MAGFVHLRVCSDYSLLSSAISVGNIISMCVSNSMPAIAITDQHNLFCALEFAEKAVSKGVQPIIGCWVDIRVEDSFFDVILIAKNKQGYANIVKLVSDSFLNQYNDGKIGSGSTSSHSHEKRNPFIKINDLINSSEGIIVLGGTLKNGLIPACAQSKISKELMAKFFDAFKDHLYVEIQRHGISYEDEVNNLIISFAYKNDLPIVATNCVLFADRQFYVAHDALVCIRDARFVTEENRSRFNEEYYFKSAQEMEELFADIPEAIENTINIAKRCCFAPKEQQPVLPTNSESGEPVEVTFVRIAREGLCDRLENYVYKKDMSTAEKESLKKTYTDRLEYELRVICEMNYAAYFLIVYDFVLWSKKNDVPVGPGRGSGAGSLVSWCLYITNIDPIELGLIFERFLNPERISMPDLDIDFCQDKRDLVIDYITKKYGNECIANIITFGTMQARVVLRDVGRVLQMPYSQVDRLCKMIPNTPGAQITLSQAIEMDENLRNERDREENVALLFDTALKLEGLHRHTSVHAAGVVISYDPLYKKIPVCVDMDSGRLLTQFSMKYVEKTGLIKFDFLGLKTLTVIKQIVELVRIYNPSFDIDRIDLNDKKTYELLSSGNNIGLFQLENSYVVEVLRKMQPNCFEDIIALISLNRPGPMDNIPQYIERKNNNEKIDYLHPMLEDILKETFGIIVYQEQVMHIAQKMAGYSMGNADILRRAMGKKIKEEMDQQKRVFIEGSMKNGVEEERASYIFELVEKFAGYGFNKSHAAAYAVISVQTAYLKTHYPKEFFVSLLSLDIHDVYKLHILSRDARNNNIQILPPDINKSNAFFSIEDDSSIRYALGACKNIGISFANELVKERETNGLFVDIFSFIERMSKKINKKVLEALIKAGALLSIHKNCKQLFDSVELLISYASSYQKEKECQQSSMFGDIFGVEIGKPNLKNTPDWDEEKKLQYEFEAFGFYLKKHPVENYHKKLERAGIVNISAIVNNGLSEASIAGVVSTFRVKPSKKGRMATIQFSDHTGMLSCVVYDESFITPDLLFEGSLLYLRVKVHRDENGMRVVVNVIQSLKDFLSKIGSDVVIVVKSSIGEGTIANIKAILGIPASPYEKKSSIKFNILMPDESMSEIKLTHSYNINKQSLEEIGRLPDVERVDCV